MFDETIIVKRSFKNSEAFPDLGELEDDFSNNNRCLLSVVNSLFSQLLCLTVLQCCCTVKRLSAVNVTLQKLYVALVRERTIPDRAAAAGRRS